MCRTFLVLFECWFLFTARMPAGWQDLRWLVTLLLLESSKNDKSYTNSKYKLPPLLINILYTSLVVRARL